MIRAGLKGLAARRLRSALTALAIVLGVGMVSAALLTGATMKKGADSLSARPTTAPARRSSPTPRAAGDYGQTPTVPRSLVARVSGLPEVGRISGDVTDLQTKLIGGDGKPIGTGPYFGVGVDARRSGGELDPFELTSGAYPQGMRPGARRCRHGSRSGLAGRRSDRGRGSRPGQGDGDLRPGPVRPDRDDRHRRRSRCSTCRAAQKLLGRGSSYDSILARGCEWLQRRAVARGAEQGAARVTSGSRAPRSGSVHAQRVADGRRHWIAVARSSSAASRSSSGRSRSSTRSRSRSPSGRASWR